MIAFEVLKDASEYPAGYISNGGIPYFVQAVQETKDGKQKVKQLHPIMAKQAKKLWNNLDNTKTQGQVDSNLSKKMQSTGNGYKKKEEQLYANNEVMVTDYTNHPVKKKIYRLK